MIGDVTAVPAANPLATADAARVPDEARTVPPREASPAAATTTTATAEAHGVGCIVNAVA